LTQSPSAAGRSLLDEQETTAWPTKVAQTARAHRRPDRLTRLTP
jgi:hypothetical protein